MRAKEFLDELKIDNEHGWGQTPNNANVDYKGLKVMMKPSIFLRLSAELPIDDAAKQNIAAMVAHHKQGGAFGAPTLYIDIPKEWEDGNMVRGFARVTGHEGRHRMNTQIESEGDKPVETHIFISGFRTRNWAKNDQNDYTSEIIEQLQTQMESEDGYIVARSPLFTV